MLTGPPQHRIAAEPRVPHLPHAPPPPASCSPPPPCCAAAGPRRRPVRPSRRPSARTLYNDGPAGRFLMDGQWLFRARHRQHGRPQASAPDRRPPAGRRVTVPNAWNAERQLGEPRSPAASAGTARTSACPARAKRLVLDRALRVGQLPLEGLAQRQADRHATRGAYLPFEIRLPNGLLKRGGTNRLVIRVDSRRLPTDFPPVGPVGDRARRPAAGGTTAACCARSTCARSTTSTSTPCRSSPTCRAPPARRRSATGSRVRNYGDAARRVARHRDASARARSTSARVGRRQALRDLRQDASRVAHPQLWSPASAEPLRRLARAPAAGRRRCSATRCTPASGRSRSSTASCASTAQPLNFRGVGAARGLARQGLRDRQRRRATSSSRGPRSSARRSSAAHYPLHPYTQERADELGILLWSEIPVYSVKTKYLKQHARPPARRRASSQSNILANGNHPSVIVWSIGNELSARPGPGPGLLHRSARSRRAKALDPTRPVGLAVAGYPSAGCQPEYGPLDVLGINDYFGWYPGPNGQIADRTLLSRLPRQRPRAATRTRRSSSPSSAPRPTATGRSRRRAPTPFQQDFVELPPRRLRDEAVAVGRDLLGAAGVPRAPGLGRRQPAPEPADPPEGPRSPSTATKKPAFFDVQRIYRATTQFAQRRRPSARRARPRRLATIAGRPWPSQATKLVHRRRASPAARARPAACAATARSPAPLRRRRASPSPSPSTRASCATRCRHAAPCSSSSSTASHDAGRPQGRPAPPGPRRDAARRPPARRLDVAIHATVAARARRRRRGARASSEGGVLEHVTREVNIEALPERRSPSRSSSTSPRWRSTTRSRSSAVKAPERRHAPRRPRGDRRRDAHAAAARGRASEDEIEEETERRRRGRRAGRGGRGRRGAEAPRERAAGRGSGRQCGAPFGARRARSTG